MNKAVGFTLVEMAIVVVIVGLLLGGVLKGQTLITNAKIQNLETNFNSLSQAVSTYQERYHALPGDDNNAEVRFGFSSDVNGNADGIIGDKSQPANYRIFSNGSENGKLWQHLRASELITGSSADYAGPVNAFGGQTGIGMATGLMPWIFIGFTNIPPQMAIIFDEHLDGSSSLPLQTGRIRAECDGKLLSTYNDNLTKCNNLLNLLFSL